MVMVDVHHLHAYHFKSYTAGFRIRCDFVTMNKNVHPQQQNFFRSIVVLKRIFHTHLKYKGSQNQYTSCKS